MAEAGSGLSDALRRMAEGDEHAAPHDADAADGNGQAAPADGDGQEAIVAQADDESHEALAHVATAGAATGGTAAFGRGAFPSSVRPMAPHGGLKAVAVPVLALVGAGLLIPGVWSILFLAGATTSEKGSAKGVAYAMLLCWPIAFCLLAAAVYYLLQIHREHENYKRRLAAWNEREALRNAAKGQAKG